MLSFKRHHGHQVAADEITARVTSAGPPRISVLASLLPTGAFLLTDALLGLLAAMVAATGVSALLLVVRRRSGAGLGILLPISLTYVLLKGAAGVATESEVVYFGVGLALTALLAIAVAATAFTERPVASLVLPLVTPYSPTDHPIYRRVSAHVTMAWALAELAITVWEAQHLMGVSGSEFVVARSVVAWPVMGAVIFCLIFYVRFRLDYHERSTASFPERRVGQAHLPEVSTAAVTANHTNLY